MSMDNSPFDVKNVCVVFQSLYETNTFTNKELFRLLSTDKKVYGMTPNKYLNVIDTPTLNKHNQNISQF